MSNLKIQSNLVFFNSVVVTQLQVKIECDNEESSAGCDVCDMFTGKNRVKRCRKGCTTVDSSKYACTEYGKCFQQKQALKTHRQTHSGETVSNALHSLQFHSSVCLSVHYQLVLC